MPCNGLLHLRLYRHRVARHVQSQPRLTDFEGIDVYLPVGFALCGILWHGVAQGDIQLRALQLGGVHLHCLSTKVDAVNLQVEPAHFAFDTGRRDKVYRIDISFVQL